MTTGWLTVAAVALAASPALASQTATARLAGPGGADMGVVTLEQGPNGVLVRARVGGLTPGAHGFHIHETGACAPDFGAAGGHYNPSGAGHGLLHADGHHAGDLPNLIASAQGEAAADAFTAAVSLDPAASNTLFDADGSAIIVHAAPDSYGESAGAGARVACGVIEAD